MERFDFYNQGSIEPVQFNTEAGLDLDSPFHTVGFVIQGERPLTFLLLIDQQNWSSENESLYMELGNILAAEVLQTLEDAITISPPYLVPERRARLMIQSGKPLATHAYEHVHGTLRTPLKTILLGPAQESSAHA